MFRKIMPAALLIPCLTAQAQSNVTLYGIIDIGVNYLNNAQSARTATGLRGGKQWSVMDGGTGGLQGSRWGLKGAEDLGGGMKAIFLLESGFSANNGTLGQGGAEFGRQAWVGISTTRYGKVTLGRQYDEVVDFYAPLLAAPQWGGYMVEHPSDLDNASNTRRVNNSIKYTSPTIAGLTVAGLYSLGGVAGSFGTNRVWSVGAGYANGPLSVGVGYLNAHNPNTSFYGTNPNAGPATANNLGGAGSATSPQSNPIYAGYASAKNLQIAAISAAYAIGPATLGVAYSNTRFQDLGSSSGPNPLGYTGTAYFHNIEASAKWQVTPAFVLGAAFDYTTGSGAAGRNGAKYELSSLGADYFLSKRTDVYTVAVYEHASGTDSLNQPAVATITGMTPSSTNNQVAVRVGIRHKF
ncbi:Outer membrane porin protein [Paraburkholderia graminis C4D1M]|uniref:Porin Gram-negative type n=1 Tax=Paraburkholderia graminis (strain ATCC 700544 / DSM 17151 / LMG 18924 / NCIMB 13744 / C4D1M) TaxID=396598 RepID=B1G4Y6_PARG4|nr:porin [Paraburkholderia graminis]EDT08755.1 porin Gram-negative type [Paraburkholderia graminis C4D1M]CAB3643319.1 Outer membrane porin protein [Paraburkholderia graminis C4D1M]